MAISCDFRVKFMQREQQTVVIRGKCKKLLLPSVASMTSSLATEFQVVGVVIWGNTPSRKI
jgi:hypothetical protein